MQLIGYTRVLASQQSLDLRVKALEAAIDTLLSRADAFVQSHPPTAAPGLSVALEYHLFARRDQGGDWVGGGCWVFRLNASGLS